MELFKRLFGGKAAKQAEEKAKLEAEQAAFDAEWQPLDAFVPAKEEDVTLVSVIASALAARDYPESEFKVTRVLERSSEATTVSVIAAAIAAGASTDSQLVVKNIYQKRGE